jgi:hypothetical protein
MGVRLAREVALTPTVPLAFGIACRQKQQCFGSGDPPARIGDTPTRFVNPLPQALIRLLHALDYLTHDAKSNGW